MKGDTHECVFAKGDGAGSIGATLLGSASSTIVPLPVKSPLDPILKGEEGGRRGTVPLREHETTRCIGNQSKGDEPGRRGTGPPCRRPTYQLG